MSPRSLTSSSSSSSSDEKEEVVQDKASVLGQAKEERDNEGNYAAFRRTQQSRAKQLAIRAVGAAYQGQLVPSSETGKKPKGSRNVPSYLSESSEEEKAVKAKEKSAAKEYGKKREEIIDLNSSFDDIDTKYLAKAVYEEAAVERKVVFSTRMRKITFNPRSDDLSKVTEALLLKPRQQPAEESSVAFTQYRQSEPANASIYSTTDSDYCSVDLEFLKELVPISPIKEMEASAAGPSGAGTKRPMENPLEEANSIAKLAKIYDKRVLATRTAKGLQDLKQGDEDCEVTVVNSKVLEPTAIAKADYKQAPTLTLSELLPNQFKPEAGSAASSKLHSSFRTEKIEFVLMCRKLVATCQEDLEWDLPDKELYDEIVNSASATFFEPDITRADSLLWSSTGQSTGVGMFAMTTMRMDLVELFRLIIRKTNHDGLNSNRFQRTPC